MIFSFFFFFFNDTATTEIYTLSLHDALPIWRGRGRTVARSCADERSPSPPPRGRRSEEHTSELQSPCNLVCRLLLEKKKQHPYSRTHSLALFCVYFGWHSFDAPANLPRDECN